MSAVLEQISEGYPADGRMFEPPEINRDNEHPRYLMFLGSLIDPDTIRSRPWTRGGGIEVTNPCLRVVKNFVRKGRITPLLKDTHDFLPFDLVKKTTEINPLQAGYFGQPIPKGYSPPNLPPGNGQFQPGFGNLAVGGPSPYGNHVGKFALPGEQLNAILIGSENLAQGNIPRGIVELTTLRNYDYRPQSFPDGTFVDPSIRKIQLAIFPTYPVLPILIDDVGRLLDAAAKHSALRAITDEAQESFNQFRDYATSTIQNTHYQMRESASRGGYVFRYTAMDIVLLEQLGMQRQDRQIQAASGSGKLEDMFAAFLASQVEEKSARAEADRRVASLIDAQTIPDTAGHPGASGYSGFSGEVLTNATASGVEAMATATADTEPPKKLHWKTREKLERDAATSE